MKHKLGRSKEYLAYIRTLECCVCRRMPVEPHHVGAGGVGLKGSDFTAVPLCRTHHREVHDAGQQTFQERYVRFSDVIATVLVDWCDRR